MCDHDVTGAQLAVLRLVREWGSPIALADMRERLVMHPATLGQMLDRLAARDLVTLTADPADRRRHRGPQSAPVRQRPNDPRHVTQQEGVGVGQHALACLGSEARESVAKLDLGMLGHHRTRPVTRAHSAIRQHRHLPQLEGTDEPGDIIGLLTDRGGGPTDRRRTAAVTTTVVGNGVEVAGEHPRDVDEVAGVHATAGYEQQRGPGPAPFNVKPGGADIDQVPNHDSYQCVKTSSATHRPPD